MQKTASLRLSFAGEKEDGDRVFETGEDGKFTLEYLPVGNNYALEEISAPQGYIKVKGTTSFNIVKAQETVSVGNSLIKGTLKLVKKDQHGKLLNGIEFVLKKGGRVRYGKRRQQQVYIHRACRQ